MRLNLSTLFSLLLLAGSANAIDLQHFHFANNSKYTFTDDAFERDTFVEEYRWIFSTDINYQNDPLITTNSENTERYNVVVSEFKTIDFGLAYKIGTRFEIGVNTSAAAATVVGSDTEIYSPGDTTLKFKTLLTSPKSKIKVALIPSLELPTGDSKAFISDNKTGWGLKGVVERRFRFFTIAGNLGFNQNLGAVYSSIDYRKMVMASLGVTVPLFGKNSIAGEAYYSRSANRKSSGNEPGEVVVSWRHQYQRNLGLWTGLGLGGLSSTDSNDYRAFVGLRFTPAKKKKAFVTPVRMAEAKKYGDLFATESIYFDHDKKEIDMNAKTILSKLKEVFKKNEGNITKIVVEGNTSAIGNKKYNIALSKKRAAEVREWLIENNIPPTMLDLVGFGEGKIKFSGDQAKNRRVDFRVYQQ